MLTITREHAEQVARQMLDDARQELASTFRVEPIARVIHRSGKHTDFRMAWDTDAQKYYMLRHVEGYIREKRALAGFFLSEIWLAAIPPNDPLDVPPAARENRTEGVSVCCQSASFSFSMFFHIVRVGEVVHLVSSDYEMFDAKIRVFGSAFSKEGQQ